MQRKGDNFFEAKIFEGNYSPRYLCLLTRVVFVQAGHLSVSILEKSCVYVLPEVNLVECSFPLL